MSADHMPTLVSALVDVPYQPELTIRDDAHDET